MRKVDSSGRTLFTPALLFPPNWSHCLQTCDFGFFFRNEIQFLYSRITIMIAAVGARRLGTVSRCFYFQSQVMNLNFKPGWSQHNPPICLRRNLSFQSFADFNHSIATSSPVQFLMTNFISFHEWLHLPWFVEIALVTFMVRACIAFPLTIHQRKIIHRYESLKPEIMQISKSLKTKTMEQAYVAGISKRKSNILYQKAVSSMGWWMFSNLICVSFQPKSNDW